MVFKKTVTGDTGEEKQCSHILGHRALQISRVVVVRHLKMADRSLVTVGEVILHSCCKDVPRQSFSFWLCFYLEYGLEMVVH